MCDQLAAIVRKIEAAEEWSPLTFSVRIPAAASKARRDYDARWSSTVSHIANRESNRLLDEIFSTLELEMFNQDATTEPFDELGSTIRALRSQGKDDARAIEFVIDYAEERQRMDGDGDLDGLEEGLIAWQRLIRVAGLDVAGALWRRSAVPHILIPSHVSKHYGVSNISLYRRLHEASRAFIFGAPLAALALQRAVLEEVLMTHWGAEGGHLRNADFPVLDWGYRASRLKNLANEALHRDPSKLKGEALERAVIQNFLILQLIIEQAPDGTSGSGGSNV